MGGREENILNKCEMFVNSLIKKFGKQAGAELCQAQGQLGLAWFG